MLCLRCSISRGIVAFVVGWGTNDVGRQADVRPRLRVGQYTHLSSTSRSAAAKSTRSRLAASTTPSAV